MEEKIMQYKCEGPGCVYTCNDKHQIHHHHIKPKAHGGSNSVNNIVRLCPNCHNRVYIPDAKRGIHSVKATNYLIGAGKPLEGAQVISVTEPSEE